MAGIASAMLFWGMVMSDETNTAQRCISRSFYRCAECGWRGETPSNCPRCAGEVHRDEHPEHAPGGQPMNSATDADTAMSAYLRDTYQELNSRADQFNLRAKEIEASRPDVADIGDGWRALADEAAKAMREIEAMYPEITGAI